VDERIEQLLKILERYIDSSVPNKEKSKMLSEVGAEIVYHFLRTAENRAEKNRRRRGGGVYTESRRNY
jgi:hypothetical protein